MNETFKGFLIIACILIIGIIIGVFYGQHRASEEITEVESNLSAANTANQAARERIGEYEKQIAELEGIAQRRQRTIQELGSTISGLKGTIRNLKNSIRKREGQIDALEKSIGRSGDATGKIAELAREGREIVEELLKSNMARPP